MEICRILCYIGLSWNLIHIIIVISFPLKYIKMLYWYSMFSIMFSLMLIKFVYFCDIFLYKKWTINKYIYCTVNINTNFPYILPFRLISKDVKIAINDTEKFYLICEKTEIVSFFNKMYLRRSKDCCTQWQTNPQN